MSSMDADVSSQSSSESEEEEEEPVNHKPNTPKANSVLVKRGPVHGPVAFELHLKVVGDNSNQPAEALKESYNPLMQYEISLLGPHALLATIKEKLEEIKHDSDFEHIEMDLVLKTFEDHEHPSSSRTEGFVIWSSGMTSSGSRGLLRLRDYATVDLHRLEIGESLRLLGWQLAHKQQEQRYAPRWAVERWEHSTVQF